MGIGVPELALLFLIVLVVFGTKRLRNIGGDLGGAIRSFRHAMKDDGDEAEAAVKHVSLNRVGVRQSDGAE
ncbi:twin-arginine translocase TatA/TatE family subunit [Methyloterricola oryzae]|uniref:twin-arginine translocase TatA/TatE family subunit n=1 Tax=Methyloterricola oryzae TaxID=1495050 RepID=UPI0009E3E141|nr:twin-arginine translocase TatA/TatE family subunit [Methyloterricola oryzae]